MESGSEPHSAFFSDENIEGNASEEWNEADEGYLKALELQQRFVHLRRITRKESRPRLTSFTGSDLLTDEEYNALLGSFSENEIKNLEKCFLVADHDRDGKLNAIELRYWMEKHNRPISQRDARHILEVTDQDEDGALNFHEFLKFCQRIGLKDNGHSHEDASIFDCLEDDNIPIHQVRRFIKEDGSYTHLKTEIWSNVEYFEEKLNDEPDISSALEKYEERIREIKQIPSEAFDLEELCQDLLHPSDEQKITCEELNKRANQRSIGVRSAHGNQTIPGQSTPKHKTISGRSPSGNQPRSGQSPQKTQTMSGRSPSGNQPIPRRFTPIRTNSTNARKSPDDINIIPSEERIILPYDSSVGYLFETTNAPQQTPTSSKVPYYNSRESGELEDDLDDQNIISRGVNGSRHSKSSSGGGSAEMSGNSSSSGGIHHEHSSQENDHTRRKYSSQENDHTRRNPHIAPDLLEDFETLNI